MITKIRFLGFAAFEIITPQDQVILIDPFLDENKVSPVKVKELKRVDLILVTHLAPDHLGDAAAISMKFDVPVICGPEVKAYLEQQGADPNLITSVSWGVEVEEKGIRVRSVECHHTSFRQAPDGQYLCGPPLSFIIYIEPGVRIYHSGDTAIFSDLKLIGELYHPNIGLICACKIEDEYLNSLGIHNYVGNEMNGDEGALAAIWLGLEVAIICHYLNPEGQEDVTRFVETLNHRNSDDQDIPKPLALRPGDTFEYA